MHLQRSLSELAFEEQFPLSFQESTRGWIIVVDLECKKSMTKASHLKENTGLLPPKHARYQNKVPENMQIDNLVLPLQQYILLFTWQQQQFIDLYSHWVLQLDFGIINQISFYFQSPICSSVMILPKCPFVFKLYKYSFFLLFLLKENGLSLLHLSDFPHSFLYSVLWVCLILTFCSIAWHKHLKKKKSE